MRWLLLVPFVVALASAAKADDVIFYWSDKQHNIHATNNLDEVPEPYKAMYRARLKELEEAKKNGPKTAPRQPAYTPSPTPAPSQPQASVVDQGLAKQKQWRDEVYRWRTELRTATEDLNRIQAQIDQVNFNPVLRMSPQSKAQLEPLELDKQKAIGRVDAAQRMLTQDLPARAKREGVPPRWLE